ncbi:uncharacterized protein LOC143446870 isoform X1 [Clavelina lepadiformis]|uniref:uncharacterized protein LOC143446870 isoform X1 n=1 Tax=Clavelina lepadiformis TaxID=159417 RepID=UPI00404222CE
MSDPGAMWRNLAEFLAVVIVLCLTQLSVPASGHGKKVCLLKNVRYSEGTQFQHEWKPGCLLNCTCVIQGEKAYGNCTKRCNPFSYPPGCKVLRNACRCPSKYTCPNGDKCRNPETGKLYVIGKGWKNDSCNCICLGERRGAFRCQCASNESKPIAQFKRNETESTNAVIMKDRCVPDKNITCYSCRTLVTTHGDPNCFRKRKCDRWPHQFNQNGIKTTLMCTCYGPRGFTQCITRRPTRKRERRSYHSSSANSMIEMYETEGMDIFKTRTKHLELSVHGTN